MERYLEAGAVAARILKQGAGLVRPGTSIREVVERIEGQVADEGFGLAFPLNISLNEDAAHDTAIPGDERTFAHGDVVKVDLGVHSEGYIADTATTVDLGQNGLLCDAARAALEAAIGLVRPGVTVGELGGVIQAEIESRGYRPVDNLTGHGLARYQIHTPPNIPNVRIHGGSLLTEGMVFAIEPFASTGRGHVTERSRREIYQQISSKPVRLPKAREIIETVAGREGMPFARRWLPGDHPEVPLAVLVRSGILHAYPVLGDLPGSLIAQAEHTLIVTSDGCLVTTR
jgi:methionyl aminopeptidase